MAQIYGQLENAALENLASDPSQGVTGRVWWNTTDGQVNSDDGTNIRSLLRNDLKAIIGNSGTAADNSRFHRGAAGVLQILQADDATAEGSLSTNLNQLSFQFETYNTAGRPAVGNAGRAIWNSDELQLQVDDGSDWQPVGSGSGQGGINYILNPSAEINADGYAAYADAADDQPVDGTGGSPTVTILRTTTASEILRGDASFEIAKDAADRQGEGVSYDFTIDNVDAENPRVQRISFDYQVSANFAFNAGTAADPSDIVVYIYDVDGAELIQPAPFNLDGSGQFVGEFQPNKDNNDYRLIFHVATTNASAWDFFFDNVQVGPNARTQGPAMTDWKTDWTPTGSWTTNTTYTGRYRRVGDSAEVQAFISLAGAPNSADFTLDLPPGLVIDTAKLATTSNDRGLDGISVWYDANIPSTQVGVVTYETTTTVQPLLQRLSSGSNHDLAVPNLTVPATWASGDSITVKFKVPIVGWSSNTQVSSDADTRVVACKYTNNGGEALTAATTDIPYATKVKDTHGAWDGDSFTAPISGFYDFEGNLQVTPSGTHSIHVYIDGTISDRVSESGLASRVYFKFSGGVYLDAGQVLSFRSSGSTTLVDNSDSNWLYISRRSGPAQIAASETIAARYSSNAAQSMTNATDTRVDFEDVALDTHNAVTIGASWVFTAPASGNYRVSCHAALASATWAVTERLVLVLYKNGASYSNLHVGRSQVADTFVMHSSGSDLVKLVAGDTISIWINQNTGGAVNTDSSGDNVHVAIERIGL